MDARCEASRVLSRALVHGFFQAATLERITCDPAGAHRLRPLRGESGRPARTISTDGDAPGIDETPHRAGRGPCFDR